MIGWETPRNALPNARNDPTNIQKMNNEGWMDGWKERRKAGMKEWRT